MLQEKGVVIGLRGGTAVVQTKNKLACSSCKVSTSCGTGIVEQYLSAKLFESELPNTLNAKVGQQVIIEIPKSSVTKASLVVYVVPLLFLFLGAIFGQLFIFSENLIILISLFKILQS